MNWEGFKTLLLTILVLLSFLLTSNLWTYETQSHHVEQSNFVTSAITKNAQNGKRALGEVVHPDKSVLHKEGKNYGLISGTVLSKLFQAVTGAKYHDVMIYGEDVASTKLANAIKEPDSDSIEIIFPTKIPISLFGQLLEGQQNGKQSGFTSDTMFDRIFFYKATQKQTTKMLAFFKSGKDTIGMAKVNNVSFADLEHYYPEENRRIFIKRKGIYFPAREPHLKELYYFSAYSWIDVERFKKALFDDPKYVVESQKNLFSSTSEVMQVKDHILQFSNTEPGTQQLNQNLSTGGGLPNIQISFNYIDSHSGWTDPYTLFAYEQPENKKSDSQATVVYRLMAGKGETKYPVFGKVTGSYPHYDDAGTILVIMENGSVYKYIRTLMDLGSSPDGSQPADLESGTALWNELSSSKYVQLYRVKDIRIGYQMKNGFPPKNGPVVFIPKWYVLYQNQWLPAEQVINGISKAQGEVKQ
ncbi:MAG TPA: two-component system activity regulator YycH [Bacillales bacterium]|nr:two-component system activity regulator YycH [Bacillales bacterium]